MTIRSMLAVIVLACMICMCHGQSQDLTKQPGSRGAGVVDTVVSRIRARCIFSEDRLFLRRLAWVASRDGIDSSTYRQGFDGGIWQVSQAMLQSTQVCTDPLLQSACDVISGAFNIHWPSVQWSELRKPLFSGLAAALSSLLALQGRSMPGNITAQANIWASMYQLPTQTFADEAAKADAIDCREKLDLVFLLDASGSVSFSDFRLMAAFAADVVEVMNVSQDAIRIADIVYSSRASLHFDFDQYSDKTTVKTQLTNTPKAGGGTNTAAALTLAQQVLDPSAGHGARRNVKKVAVLVTDGQSNSFTSTVMAASYLKGNGSTVFAVGVGNYRMSELQAVATAPNCSHVLTLTGFDQITSILTEIQKSTCDAVIHVTDNTVITGALDAQASTTTSAQVVVPDVSVSTVQANVSCGILDVYVSTLDQKPGPTVYDARYQALPNSPAVLTLVDTLPQGAPVYITVVGTRLPAKAEALLQCSDYSWSLGVNNRTRVTVTCERNGVVQACTPTDLANSGVCPQGASNANYPVDNPCTSDNLQNGRMRHIYPYDPSKFIQCDMKGQYYITACPGGVTFNTLSMECGFTSPGVGQPNDPGVRTNQTFGNPSVVPLPSVMTNPCTIQALQANKYYHSYSPDKAKYVQCDEWGQSWVMPCATGTEWSQTANTCVHAATAPASPKCTPGVWYVADDCDHHSFYQCTNGKAVHKTCHPSSLFFHPTYFYCGWVDVNTNTCASSSG